jgi:hypothetical protein
MFKVFVGIGILATPASLQKVGVIGGAFCIFLCGIFNVYTMNLQIQCKLKAGVKANSYSQLSLIILG